VIRALFSPQFEHLHRTARRLAEQQNDPSVVEPSPVVLQFSKTADVARVLPKRQGRGERSTTSTGSGAPPSSVSRERSVPSRSGRARRRARPARRVAAGSSRHVVQKGREGFRCLGHGRAFRVVVTAESFCALLQGLWGRSEDRRRVSSPGVRSVLGMNPIGLYR